jgi:hypothetical protein
VARTSLTREYVRVTDYILIEDSDALSFVTADNLVTQLKVDHRFSVVVGSGFEIVIEEPFTLQLGDGAATTVPSGEAHEVEAALPLFGDRVQLVRATPAGELEVLLESGRRIWVPVSDDYENWQVVFPDGRLWVGTPGGGVTTFPPDSMSLD